MSYIISLVSNCSSERTYHLVLLTSSVPILLFATLSLTRPSKSAIPCKSVMAFPSAFSSLRFVKHANSAYQLTIPSLKKVNVRNTESSWLFETSKISIRRRCATLVKLESLLFAAWRLRIEEGNPDK